MWSLSSSYPGITARWGCWKDIGEVEVEGRGSSSRSLSTESGLLDQEALNGRSGCEASIMFVVFPNGSP